MYTTPDILYWHGLDADSAYIYARLASSRRTILLRARPKHPQAGSCMPSPSSPIPLMAYSAPRLWSRTALRWSPAPAFDAGFDPQPRVHLQRNAREQSSISSCSCVSCTNRRCSEPTPDHKFWPQSCPSVHGSASIIVSESLRPRLQLPLRSRPPRGGSFLCPQQARVYAPDVARSGTGSRRIKISLIRIRQIIWTHLFHNPWTCQRLIGLRLHSQKFGTSERMSCQLSSSKSRRTYRRRNI